MGFISTLTSATVPKAITTAGPTPATSGSFYSKRNGNMWIVATGVTKFGWTGTIHIWGKLNGLWIHIDSVSKTLSSIPDATVIYWPDEMPGVTEVHVSSSTAIGVTPFYFLMYDPRIDG
jgi:hypothetical protein